MKCALYARVSTDEQAEKGTSLDSQLAACKRYALEGGMQVMAAFRDDYTGSRIDRPELQKLLQLVRNQEVDAVVCYASDRWSRSVRVALDLHDTLLSSGVDLYYVNRGKVENTPEGEMFDGIENQFNQFWKHKIIEATNRGKIGKAQQGKPVMAGYPPYGYYREGMRDTAKMLIHPEESEVVRKIFIWYAYGDENGNPISLYTITSRLNEMGVSTPHYPMDAAIKRQVAARWIPVTVSSILANEIYTGRTYYGKTQMKAISPTQRIKIKKDKASWIRIEVPELAIIDRETFDLAQQRKKTNIEQSRRNQKHNYLLSGFIKCNGCKGAMSGHYSRPDGNQSFHYRCTNKINVNRFICPQRNKSISMNIADSKVWDWLVGLWSDEEELQEGLEAIAYRKQEELEPKRREVTRLRSMAARQENKAEILIAQIGDTDSPQIAALIKAQAQRELEIANEYIKDARMLEAELVDQDITPEMLERVKVVVRRVKAGAEDPTYETMRGIFNMLNLRVIFRVDETGRWLDLSCGLKPEGDTIPLCLSSETQPNYAAVLFRASLAV